MTGSTGDYVISVLFGLLMAPVLVWVVRDLESRSASRFWVAGWLLWWLAGIATLWDGGGVVLRMLATAGWYAGAGCQLAGARAFVGQANSRRLALLATGFGVVIVGTQPFLSSIPGGLVPSFGSGPLLVFAAAVVIAHARRPDARHSERTLGLALAVMALLDLTDWMLFLWQDLGVQLFAIWGIVSIAVAMNQVLALGDRERARAANLAEEREALRRISLALGEPDFGARFMAALAPTRYEQRFRAFGVWVKTGHGDELEHITGEVRGAALPESLRLTSLGHPLVQAAVSGGPLFVEDLQHDPRIRGPVKRTGLDSAFLAPLRVGDEVVGLLGGLIERGYSLDADTRHFISDLADQMALVVAATRLREATAAQAEHMDAEQRVLRAMTEAVPTGILMTDPNGDVLLVNENLCEMFGFESPAHWIGRDAREFLAGLMVAPSDPGRLGTFAKIHTADRRQSVDGWELQFENGLCIEVAARPVFADGGARIGRVWVIRDVTEERALGERIQQADRMQTLGTLAGGLAHDFNNQLTAILGNAALVEVAVADVAEAREPLQDLQHAARHCAELTQGLLAFARREPPEPRAVEVGHELERVQSLLAPAMPVGVTFEVEVADDAGWVRADPAQLNRVLTNLLVNARDAVGGAGHRLAPRRPRARGGRFRALRRRGRRLRHRRPGAAPHLRSLLHHQGGAARHRAGARRGLRHRREPRGHPRAGVRAGEGGALHDLLAGRQRGGGDGSEGQRAPGRPGQRDGAEGHGAGGRGRARCAPARVRGPGARGLPGDRGGRRRCGRGGRRRAHRGRRPLRSLHARHRRHRGAEAHP